MSNVVTHTPGNHKLKPLTSTEKSNAFNFVFSLC